MHAGWRGRRFNEFQFNNETESEPMSQAAWCNINDPETNAPKQTGHAFDTDDPDREHFTKTRQVQVETGNSYGRTTYQERQEITESLDMCGYHSRKQAGLFQKTPELVTAETIEDIEADADQADAEMWKARYEAEHAARVREIF